MSQTSLPAKNRKAKADSPEYQKVKLRMVDAAIELMADKGVKKFRFEALAEEVACNRATIYRYFDSKQDLIREVMMRLMHQITNEEIERTAGEEVTEESFTDFLYSVITQLRTNRRYKLAMESDNVAMFSQLTHEYFSAITMGMLEMHMANNPAGQLLKDGISLPDAVHWLLHQIVSYAFLGLKGESEAEQKDYLEKMVVAVII